MGLLCHFCLWPWSSLAPVPAIPGVGRLQAAAEHVRADDRGGDLDHERRGEADALRGALVVRIGAAGRARAAARAGPARGRRLDARTHGRAQSATRPPFSLDVPDPDSLRPADL